MILATNNKDYLALSDQYGNPTGAPYISIAFNYSSIEFGALDHNTANNEALGQTDGRYNVTVNSSGGYTAEASGTNFDDGDGHTFYVGNLTTQGRGDTSCDIGSGIGMSTYPQSVLNPPTYYYSNSTTDNYWCFWVSIPESQYASGYTSSVTITYSSV
jgi:hypothetical protein